MGETAHGKERMTDFDVLVDSDAFVGLFFPDDAHHQTCFRLFKQFAKKNLKLVATSYTVAETATVLSHRSGQPLARAFLDYVATGVLPVVHIDEALQTLAISIFREQANKNTSLFDCANVAVMRNLNIPRIFSFDRVYSRKFALQTAE